MLINVIDLYFSLKQPSTLIRSSKANPFFNLIRLMAFREIFRYLIFQHSYDDEEEGSFVGSSTINIFIFVTIFRHIFMKALLNVGEHAMENF